MLFSIQVLAQILQGSRLTSKTQLAELNHSRLCWLCHLSDEFEYLTAAGSLARASLVWTDLHKRLSLESTRLAPLSFMLTRDIRG